MLEDRERMSGSRYCLAGVVDFQIILSDLSDATGRDLLSRLEMINGQLTERLRCAVLLRRMWHHAVRQCFVMYGVKARCL